MIELGKVLAFNFAIVALFAVFAFYMDKWWIIFFAILFLEHPKIYIVKPKEEEEDFDE